jgi:hypothetical protein
LVLLCLGIEKPINKENEMIADSHQTGTLEVSRRARPVRFGLTAGWLILGLAVASLLVGLIWSYNLVRYPGAERQAASQFQLRFQPLGNLSQQSAYQTPDDLPQVLSWYTQHFGLGHDMPQGDNCVRMTQVDAHLFLQQSLAVTLCAYPTRTLIFIDRSLAVR